MKNFISIPKPCSESWDGMSQQEQGRHCAKCNIVVKDFSAMSNEEVLDYLNRNKVATCGRLRTDQLNTPLEFNAKLKKFLYFLVIIFLPLAPFQNEAVASENIKIEAEQNSEGIKGKVYNEKGQTVPFAIVIAYEGGVQKGASKTDLNGNYKLVPLAPGIYTLKITQLGYNPLDVTNVEIKANTIYSKNFTINKPKGNVKLGRTFLIGAIKSNSLIDQEHPNEQKMTGDELRRMMGGR